MFVRNLAIVASVLTLACALTGCGQDAELKQARQDIQDLKARVATLEGQVQAMAASLPEDASIAPAARASSDQ